MSELVQLPFARGIDEGADPKGLAAGTPITLDNCYHDKLGRLVKRPGVSALAATILSGGSISTGERIVTDGERLAIFDGEKLYSYSDTLAKWQAVDRPSPLTVRSRPLIDCTRSVKAVDIVAKGNLLLTFYEAGTLSTPYLYAEVRRLDTGEIVKSAEYVATGSNPRVLLGTDETTAYLLWSNSGGELMWGTMVMSTLAITVQSALTASAAASTLFDAVLYSVSGTDRIFTIYCLAAGASRVRLESWNVSSGASVNTATVAGTEITGCCIATNGTNVHALYGGNSLVRLVTTDMTMGSAVGPTTIDASAEGAGFVAVHSATEILAGWFREDGFATEGKRLTTALYSVAAHAQTASSVRRTFGVTVPSKPWQINSRWYTAVATYLYPYSLVDYSAAPQASVVILEVETAASLTGTTNGTHPHVATLENQTGWFPNTLTITPAAMIMKPATAAAGSVYLPAAYRNLEQVHAWAVVPIGFNLHTITVGDEAWGQTATVGKAALGASAAPFWWDGATAMPYGFVHAPIILSAADTAGGSMAVGTYGYLTHYGWRDANGMLHRSPVSPSKSEATAGGNLSIAVSVSTSSVSSKQRASFGSAAASPVWVLPYRTEVGGSIYYRLTYEPQSNVLFSDPQTDDVTITDTVADGAIASGIALSAMPQIYTASGALDDVCPPAALAALSHLDRAWLLAADGHTVWATKNISDDPTVAPGFNEALTTYFAAPKTCLGALSGAVVVMGEDSIDLITGTGPDATGSGAWGQQGVQTDLGCTSPRSLATIPQGLVYQSRRGIEMLTTGLTIEWIGEAVRDQLETYPNVTSAVVVSDKRQVRISVVNDAEDDGVVLVFDYGRNAWSVWDYGFAVVDAAMIGNVYTLLRSSGIVYRESSTSSRDGTTYVSMGADVVVTTSGPNAWQRLKHVQLLGTSVTPHALTMKIKRDFATSYEYEKTFASATEATDVGPLEKVRITLPTQKGQGFVVRIEDSAPDSDDTSDAGSGPILESLALWVQRRPGLPRVSASRRG